MFGPAKESYDGWTFTRFPSNKRVLNVFLCVKFRLDQTKIVKVILFFYNLAGTLIGQVCVVGYM